MIVVADTTPLNYPVLIGVCELLPALYGGIIIPTAVLVELLAHIESQHRDLAGAIELAQDFCTNVRQRRPDRLDYWLARAIASGVAPLRRFASGLHADYEAVKAGATLPWSTGPVEGHINRLKMLRRSMFGRAKLDLLSRRFLLAA